MTYYEILLFTQRLYRLSLHMIHYYRVKIIHRSSVRFTPFQIMRLFHIFNRRYRTDTITAQANYATTPRMNRIPPRNKLSAGHSFTQYPQQVHFSLSTLISSLNLLYTHWKCLRWIYPENSDTGVKPLSKGLSLKILRENLCIFPSALFKILLICLLSLVYWHPENDSRQSVQPTLPWIQPTGIPFPLAPWRLTTATVCNNKSILLSRSKSSHKVFHYLRHIWTVDGITESHRIALSNQPVCPRYFHQ